MLAAVAVTGALVVGCSGRTSVVPNPDPALRKSSAQFAADAARRSYPTDAPRGGEAVARAEVGYQIDRINFVNLSDEDWTGAEVWVNEKYVCYLPNAPKGTLKLIQFQMLYDDSGNYFPVNNNKVMVNKVEVFKDGTLYDVPVRPAY